MTQLVRKGVDSFALVLIAVSVIAAHLSPATGYELSIYKATPVVVWLGLGTALLVAVFSILFLNSTIGYVTAALSLLSWASMRPIRGHYMSGADSLVHLGRVKYIISNNELFDAFYPATHLLSVSISWASGLSPRRSLIITTPLFVTVFILFITLIGRRFSTFSTRDTSVAFLTSLLLLPINWLGVHIQPHPSSYAILISPAVLFVVMKYWTTNHAGIFYSFIIITVFFAYLHPLIALLLTGILGTVACVNYALSGYPRGQAVAANGAKWTYWVTAITVGIIIVFRAIGLSTIQAVALTTIQSLGSLFTQRATTTQRATGLSEIGVNPIVLVVKLLGISIFTGFIATISTTQALYRWIASQKISYRFTILLYGGIVVLLPMFMIFLLSDFLLYFRILGMVMVLTSIVFIFGLTDISSNIGRYISVTPRQFIVVIFVPLLVLSLTIANPSPYIAQSSKHRTQSQLATVDTLTTHATNESVLTVRSHYPRLKWAVTGQRPTFIRQKPPDHFNDRNLPTAYNQPRYLLVTERDYQIDVRLYNGFRFDAGDFAYLDRETRMNRVIDTGGGTVYRTFNS